MSTPAWDGLPVLATTGVGSLPFVEPADAIAHVTGAYQVPFCPQLPHRDGDMIQEWLGSDPSRCGWSPDRDRERPVAWDAFVAQMRDDPPAHGMVKLQVTGPVTLAIALERACARRGLSAAARELAAEIATWLAAGAAGQVGELEALGVHPILVVDEPGLAAAGLSREHAAIWDPLRAAAGNWGVHVCGAVPWSLVDEVEPDVLSFDLTRGALEPPARQTLDRLVRRGGRVLWGAVDPVRPGDVETAAARLIAAMFSLGELRPASHVVVASLVSPACGSGRLSLEGELRLAATLDAVAGVVRDGLAIGRARQARR
ncbi:MAG TPA: hypothetical protein VMF07_07275 [Solirubrobacteraceae bacterium]|nr:hypothetical protein [Solirubrobacteraceae bacterium]